MFEAGGGAGGAVLRARPGKGGARTRSGSAATETDDEGRLLSPEEGEVDAEVRRRAREIAARLSLPKPRSARAASRGAGVLASRPYRGAADELDLDATLEVLAEHPVPEEDDLVVRDRVRSPRAVVLLVDVSGSMKGERVRTAAATVGALAAELEQDRLAVIAFWSDAAILNPLDRRASAVGLLDAMLRIPAKGLTNVGFPLQLAAEQLAGVPQRDARVVLLSDCVHNAGPDPRPIAARLPRLDVLLDTTGERDVRLGRELAAAGRGRYRALRNRFDVAPALSSVFRT
ncbi:vWA domain-containing protein [Amnibacterium endophyticum]|uniref:VWA domain-containing protein n=1 Tax=Amnibacterium endophyticum TaxID=2109337 RepID=A0ABW4LHI7_9MICO